MGWRRWLLAILTMLLLGMPGVAQTADIDAMVRQLFPPPRVPVAALQPLVNPVREYSYETLLEDVAALQRQYPGLVEVHDIGTSAFGRRLIAIKLGRGKEEILLNGAHHGREWMTSALLMHMLDQYALAYYRGEFFAGLDAYDLLNQVSIWCVPMVNPDGVALVQHGAKSAPDPAGVIRLNGGNTDFSAWKANGHGVDLNRQYPARWERITDSPGKPMFSNFKGRAPLQEPEVAALSAFVLAHPFAMHAAFHSAGEIIYWHFDQTGALRIRCERMAVRLRGLTGYSLIPAREDASGGGYKDWVVSKLAKPAFTIEVGPTVRSGPVALSEYQRIWPRVRASGLLLAHEAVQAPASGALLQGYLDGELIQLADRQQPLQTLLQGLVDGGYGSSASISGGRPWRYPRITLYHVMLNGKSHAVHSSVDGALTTLRAAVAKGLGPGGYILTNGRLLVGRAGATPEHAVTLTRRQPEPRVDGTPVAVTDPVQEIDGRLYVPLTFLADALGGGLTWSHAAQTALVEKAGTRLLLHPGTRLLLVNDAVTRLEAPTRLTKDGHLLVPVRVLAEYLGGCVSWDPTTQAVTISWYESPTKPAEG